MFARSLAVALCVAAVSASSASAQAADTLSLTLEDAIARALRGEEVQAARAQIAAADAQVITARASGLPQLRLNGTYQHVFANARAQAVGQIFNQPNTYNVNANISQTVFQGGRFVAGFRAARAARSAARLTADEIVADVTLAVQHAYFQSLFTNRMYDIQNANYRLAVSRLEQVERFQTAGRVARYEVLRARVERANLEPLVAQAENDRTIALLELRRLANLPPQQSIHLTTSLTAETVAPLIIAVDNPFELGEGRPSIRAAELTAHARRQAIAIARADLLPTFSIFFQTGYQAFPVQGLPPLSGEVSSCPSGSTATRCNNGGFFPDRTLGMALSWPIFDGLRAKGNIDLAQANAQLAELALRQEREAVALEIAGARAMVDRARALFEARKESAGEASEAFRLASLRFDRGLDTQLEVSDAQVALLTAQTNEARAIFDLVLASAELARALGKPLPFAPVRTAPRPTPITDTENRE